jgi:hypothetical protein
MEIDDDHAIAKSFHTILRVSGAKEVEFYSAAIVFVCRDHLSKEWVKRSENSATSQSVRRSRGRPRRPGAQEFLADVFDVYWRATDGKLPARRNDDCNKSDDSVFRVLLERMLRRYCDLGLSRNPEAYLWASAHQFKVAIRVAKKRYRERMAKIDAAEREISSRDP